MATFTVTTLTDGPRVGSAYADGELSLREAIELSNESTGADQIAFAPELAGVVTLTEGVLRVTGDLTIAGGGLITISGDTNGDDVLTAEGLTDLSATAAAELDDNTQIILASRSLTLEGVTLTGGRTTANSQGGGAFRAGDVTLTDSVIAGNSTTGSNSSGGGFSASGNVTITDSTISGNMTEGSSARGGGVYGVYADIQILNSTITGNSTLGVNATGGGVYALDGELIIENSIILGNVAQQADHDASGVIV